MKSILYLYRIRYIDNLNNLYNAKNYLYAQRKARLNNFINEKKVIKDIISNKICELFENPEEINI